MIRGLQTPATGHDRAGEPGETDATLDKLDKMMSAKVGRRLAARDDNAETPRHRERLKAEQISKVFSASRRLGV